MSSLHLHHKTIFPYVLYQSKKGDVVLTTHGLTFYSDVDWPKPTTTLRWSAIKKVTANSIEHSDATSPKLRVTEDGENNHFFTFRSRAELERARSEMNVCLEDKNLGDGTSKRAPMPPPSLVDSGVTSTTLDSTDHPSHAIPIHATARVNEHSRRRSTGEIGHTYSHTTSSRRRSYPPLGTPPPPPPHEYSPSTTSSRRISGTARRASEHSKSQGKLPSVTSAASTNWEKVPNIETTATSRGTLPSVTSSDSTNWESVPNIVTTTSRRSATEESKQEVSGSETRSTATTVSHHKVPREVHHRRHSGMTESTMSHTSHTDHIPKPIVQVSSRNSGVMVGQVNPQTGETHQQLLLDISQHNQESPPVIHITPLSSPNSQEEWTQVVSLCPDRSGGRRIHRVYDEVIEIDPTGVTKVTGHEKTASKDKDPDDDDSYWIFKSKQACMEWAVITFCCCLLMVAIILIVYFSVREEEESSADKARKAFYANAFDAYWI